jgi:carbonic anhydrase
MERVSRRRFLEAGAVATGAVVTGGLITACGSSSATPVASTTTTTPVSNGNEALSRLMEGNARFVRGNPANQGRDTVRRAELAEGQYPFATIVGCSDSRVAPEVLFDQGLGDLFIVRVAGNTASDPLLIGSIEFSVSVLKTKLVMVLGHQNCGAVKAAVEEVQGTLGSVPGDLPAVVQPILPAARAVQGQPAGDQVEAAIQENVRMQAQSLQTTASASVLTPQVQSGTLKVVGGEYILTTGEVKLLD